MYVHIDLDVHDPAEFGSVCYPEPDGVPSQRLVDLITRLDNVAGAGVTEHAPADGAGGQLGTVGQHLPAIVRQRGQARLYHVGRKAFLPT